MRQTKYCECVLCDRVFKSWKTEKECPYCGEKEYIIEISKDYYQELLQEEIYEEFEKANEDALWDFYCEYNDV